MSYNSYDISFRIDDVLFFIDCPLESRVLYFRECFVGETYSLDGSNIDLTINFDNIGENVELVKEIESLVETGDLTIPELYQKLGGYSVLRFDPDCMGKDIVSKEFLDAYDSGMLINARVLDHLHDFFEVDSEFLGEEKYYNCYDVIVKVGGRYFKYEVLTNENSTICDDQPVEVIEETIMVPKKVWNPIEN